MVKQELTSTAKILVLFANAYEMQDDRGRAMTGCSVHYLFWGENGEALLSQVEFNPAKPVGIQRAKCSMDFDLREKLVVAPGLYLGSFVTTTGGDGKPVLKLRDVSFISHVDITPRILPGFVVPGMVDPSEQRELAGLEPEAEDDSRRTEVIIPAKTESTASAGTESAAGAEPASGKSGKAGK